ncbi:MAG: alpha/beta hydrolase [Pseudomonadota bacterium]
MLATNRGGPGLSGGRGDLLRFAALDVAMPAGREVGGLPLGPDGFGLAAATRLDAAGLTAALRGPEEPVIWIHGYNNNAAEAVYRQAQLAEDLALSGPQISFVWPSAGRYVGYMHDRDSVLQARGPTQTLLRMVAARTARPPLVLAHSMGGFLAMEVLRDARQAGQPLDKAIGTLVLIQPDVDLDVFLAQARAAAPLPPMAVVTRRDDVVLRLSARLAGRRERLGSTSDRAAIEALGIRTLDLTGVGDSAVDHLSVLTSPSVLAFIRALRAGRADLPMDGVPDL